MLYDTEAVAMCACSLVVYPRASRGTRVPLRTGSRCRDSLSPNLWGRQAPSIAVSLRHLLDLRWSLTTELGYRRLEGRVAREHTFPTGRTQKFSRGLWDLAFGGEFNFFPYSHKYRYLLTRSWTLSRPRSGASIGQRKPNTALHTEPLWCIGSEVQAQ